MWSFDGLKIQLSEWETQQGEELTLRIASGFRQRFNHVEAVKTSPYVVDLPIYFNKNDFL